MEDKSGFYSSASYRGIAVIQAKSGDISGAQSTVEKISKDREKYGGLMAIAEAQHKADKPAEALPTLLQAKEAFQKTRPGSTYYYSKIVELQIKCGDIQAALQTASLVDKDYKSQTENSFNVYYQKTAESRLKAGDMKGAREMVERITDESRKKKLLEAISQEIHKNLQEKIDQGDPARARLLAESIPVKTIKIKALLELKDFSTAQTILKGITDPKEKAEAQLVLVRGYRVSGDQDQRRESLLALKEILLGSKGESLQDELRAWVELLLKSNEIAEAKQANRQIKSEYSRLLNYRKIAEKEAENGQFVQALQTAALLDDATKKNDVFQEIVKKTISHGEVDRAKEVAAFISDKKEKDLAYKEIASWQAAQGYFSQARETAGLISAGTVKVKVYREIAVYQNLSGYIEGAGQTLAQMKKMTDLEVNPSNKAESYVTLSDGLNWQPDGAGLSKEALWSARDWALKIPDPKLRASHLDSIFIKLMNSGLFSPARETMLTALDSAALIKSDGSWGNDPKFAFGVLATRQADSGDFIGALQTAYLIEERVSRELTLADLGRKTAEWGDLKSALGLIKELTSRNRQDTIYGAIAKRLVKEGNIPEAIRIVSLIQSSSEKKWANTAIIQAYLNKGDRGAARQLASQYKDDPSYDLFGAMTQAGELDWARQSLARLRGDFWLEHFFADLAVGQVKAGDLKGVRDSAATFPSRRACLALAEAGDSALARDCAGRLSKEENVEVVLALAWFLAKKGDVPGAKKIIDQVEQRGLNIETRRGALVDAQLAIGDFDGARETLALLHPRDKEFEPWANQVIASSKGNPSWKQTALDIKDPYWRSLVFSLRAHAEKTLAAFKEQVAVIPDKRTRSRIVLFRMRQEVKKGSLTEALGLIELIPDPEFKLTALGEITQVALRVGTPSGFIPKILSLPDGPGKVTILLDTVKILLERGDTRQAIPLLPVISKSIALMTDGLGKVWAYRELGLVAGRLKDRKLADRGAQQSETLAGRLNEEERGLWTRYKQQFSFSAVTGTDPDPEQIKAAELQKKKVEKWSQFLAKDLNKPLYLDLSGSIQSLGTQSKSWDIFSGLTDKVVEMAAMFKKIKAMEKEN
jgi:hypothetical protein